MASAGVLECGSAFYSSGSTALGGLVEPAWGGVRFPNNCWNLSNEKGVKGSCPLLNKWHHLHTCGLSIYCLR